MGSWSNGKTPLWHGGNPSSTLGGSTYEYECFQNGHHFVGRFGRAVGLEVWDYVAVLKEIIEVPSFHWFDTALCKRDELVRMQCIPTGSGVPLKIKAVCLPFVFVKQPLGQCETIDVRPNCETTGR
jgi:hypothetical protein